MAEPLIRARVREAVAEPEGALVLLHGRGADEHDLHPLLDALDPEPRLLGVTPRGPLSLPPGGAHWYALGGLPTPEPATFWPTFEATSDWLDELPVPLERTVLGGFSQGAVMSWALGLGRGRTKRPAGIIALSGFMPEVEGLELELAGLEGYPVAIGHGAYDEIIPVQFGRRGARAARARASRPALPGVPAPAHDRSRLPARPARPRRARHRHVTDRHLARSRLARVEGLAELHTHLGGSVASDILWSLAHEQGISLPVKDYWEFDALVTVSDPRGVEDLNALDRIYHWTELIQSSPIAVERSVHGAIGGAYRSQGITTLELRFNPMKRNRGGERDLDHIILAAIRGVDRASIEYPEVRCGLILMMDRTFTPRQNEIVVEKAIRWASRGVVGIDIAGPRPDGGRYDYTQVAPMVETARAAGLGITIHVGEEGATGAAELGEVVEHCAPTASATASSPPATPA